MPRSKLSPEAFPDKRVVRDFEGGDICTAERAGKWYVIDEENAFRGLLSEEDQEGLEFARVYEFDTEADRECYLHSRPWWPPEE